MPTKERPTSYTHRGERFFVVAMIALFLLAIEWFIGDRRRIAAGAAALALVAGLGAAPSTATGAGANDAVKLYNEGDYLGALARFREAFDKHPSAPLYYDIGNSLYRLDKFDEAARHYADSIEGADPVLERNAKYNTGNCLFNSGDLQGAIDRYIDALKLDPNDEDSKHNLELAERMLQQGQSEPQGGEGEENQEGDQSQEGEQSQQGGAGDQEERSESESGDQDAGDRPEDQPGEKDAEPQDGEGARFSREEAERLLEALAGDEKDLLSKRMKSKVRRKGGKKNW